MKKYCIGIILCLFIIVSCKNDGSSSKQDTTLTSNFSSGERIWKVVKSESDGNANPLFGAVVIPSSNQVATAEFDENGLVSKINISLNNTLDTIYEYTYNINEDIVSKTTLDGPSGVAWYLEEYIYDINNILIQIDNKNYVTGIRSSYYIFEYYPSGLLKKLSQFSDNNVLIRYNEYEYNEVGELTKKIYTYNCKTTPHSEYSLYVYNNNFITETHYNNDIITWTRIIEMDSIENIILQSDRYNELGNLIESYTYGYETVEGDSSQNDWYFMLEADLGRWD